MKPLDGIKVLEVSNWISGPTCATVLADCGADVIKLEHLQTGGDPARGWVPVNLPKEKQINWVFEAINRGKRSLALDLGQDKGQEVLQRLIRDTDILVTNVRISTAETLHLDFETLGALNPRLIYARITGFGARGPDKDRMGFDSLSFWARSGLMDTFSPIEGPPVPIGCSLGDVATGTFLFAAIMMALYNRESTGEGSLVETSLYASGVWTSSEAIWSTLIGGSSMPKLSREEFPNPLLQLYRCSDDRWVNLCILQSERYWSVFCSVIDRPDMETDPRFIDQDARAENSAALVALLEEEFGKHPLDYWAPRLDEAHIAWEPTSEIEEVASDPQLYANQSIVEVDHPHLGRIKEVAAPFQFNQETLASRTSAPEFGSATEEILQEHDYSWDEILELKNQKVII